MEVLILPIRFLSFFGFLGPQPLDLGQGDSLEETHSLERVSSSFSSILFSAPRMFSAQHLGDMIVKSYQDGDQIELLE